SVIAVVHGDDGAAMATLRGCATSEATYTLPHGAAVAAIECDGSKPLRAFVVRHARRGEIVATPLTWRGRFVAEQLTARVGDALRIGGADDAIPGLTTWDMPAPHGAAAMVAIPADPTDCAAWAPEATTRPSSDAAFGHKGVGSGAASAGSASEAGDAARPDRAPASGSGATRAGEAAGSDASRTVKGPG